MEDFERPRIIYREIGIEMDACMVDKGWMVNNKLYMISGSYLNHLINFLNSKLFNKIILTTANLTGGKGVDFLEKVIVPSMATHSRVLTWRIPGTGELGGLPSMGSHRVGHD